MARNIEKANHVLNRVLIAKQAEARGPRAKRPYLASECADLNEADKWRQQILREIGAKVMEIQNAALGEHRLRDLNDEINKLIREKGHWDARILELGGPDYAKAAPKVSDASGTELASATGRGGGYRYFGAAKQLPGVKELFQKEAPRAVRRTRAQMIAHVNADYYGFRDEEDGVLVAEEAEAERVVKRRMEEEWEAGAGARAAAGDGGAGTAGGVADVADDGPEYVAYVPLPDSKVIEQRVLEKKKADLLAKYASPALAADQARSRELLHKQ